MTVDFGLSVGAQSGSGSAVFEDRSSFSGSTGSAAAGSAGSGACASDGAAASGAGAAGAADAAGSGGEGGAVASGGTDSGAEGTVSHDGVGTAVVVVGGAVVVLVGAVVVGVAHGSTGVGASSGGVESGATLGVGAGVVDGCANAAEVPEISISATVPAVNNDRVAERDRLRGGRSGFNEIIMDFLL